MKIKFLNLKKYISNHIKSVLIKFKLLINYMIIDNFQKKHIKFTHNSQKDKLNSIFTRNSMFIFNQTE
jgi:hypothetical protein